MNVNAAKRAAGVIAAIALGMSTVVVCRQIWPPIQQETTRSVSPDTSGAIIAEAALRLPNSVDGQLVAMVFTDFQCPFCRVFALTVEPVLRKRYSEPGQAIWLLRHHPLDSLHPLAIPAASYQVCAERQGQGDQVAEQLFRTKAQVKAISPGVTVGLNTAAFAECLTTTARSVLAMDAKEAAQAGVVATPTLVLARVRGRDLVIIRKIEGSRSADVYLDLIDQALSGQDHSLTQTNSQRSSK